MSMTYRRWTWADTATEEQMESVQNNAACDRLAEEARALYDSIPDPRANRDLDYADEDPEFDTKDEYESWRKERLAGIQIKWGQLSAIENLLHARGGRFARDYEHCNQD